MQFEPQGPGPSGGSVPHHYRNAIFWRWAPALPRSLRQGFLTLLYVLGTAANTSGALRFRDGTPLRLQDIAKACGSDIKDVRRYIDAAIAAGVVAVDGERKRGKRAVFVIALAPSPDWNAAVAHLAATKPKPKAVAKPAPWQSDEDAPEKGGRSPELPSTGSSGDQPPNFPEPRSGDQPPNGFGGPTPDGFGGPTPQQPMSSHELPQEMAGLGSQPQDACARVLEDQPQAAAAAPKLRPVPGPPGGPQATDGKGKSSSQQQPLLLPVRTPAHVSETTAEMRAAAAEDDVRAAIAQHGPEYATTLYGWRLVAPLLNDPDHDTGS